MEIVSYVLEGALEHKDTMGTGSVIRPGDVQRMSAGTGVRHSEFNASQRRPVHFLQIWIVPGSRRHRARLRAEALHRRREARPAAAGRLAGRARGLGHDPPGRAGLRGAARRRVAAPAVARGRHAWVQVARGSLAANGVPLDTGDAAYAAGPVELNLHDGHDAEVLLFDLP